jgi:hypothetical protein
MSTNDFLDLKFKGEVLRLYASTNSSLLKARLIVVGTEEDNMTASERFAKASAHEEKV